MNRRDGIGTCWIGTNWIGTALFWTGWIWGFAAAFMVVVPLAGEEVGPATEARFPPLQAPEGFDVTLFACDPLVEYPSVIALGPRPGSLFVAHDYVTGLGVEIVRRDEIRLLEDTDADGYADRSTVFAAGFNSIQGLASDGDAVFAMHAPLLTVVRDTDGDGVADERRDLLDGLGLPPEENDNRLHCANGVVVGHDGWLYLALGDRGCDVLRPEGDRLIFREGGILRCRPDGTDLHVFSGGMRNIYDIALDDQLNVFVRDNENDGGDFMIRVCHSFFGADHGYPYLYHEHPDEAMVPLADLGRGSSAGGVCYREAAFPDSFRGALLFCEWGRAVVRYPRRAHQSGFAATQEHDFVSGADEDPYGFKPTDLVVDRDGTLLVSDWADGQRPKRGRGRIYRVAWRAAAPPEKFDDALKQLDAESYQLRYAAQKEIAESPEALRRLKQALDQQQIGFRGRQHAIWILSRAEGPDCLDRLFTIAETDPDVRVRAQSVRAIADLTDPVLVQDRLDAGRGDAQVARRLAELAQGKKGPVVLEVVIALGRLRWRETPRWLSEQLAELDPTLAHAAQQALRRSGNWEGVLSLTDRAGPLRKIALRAVARQAEVPVVDGLIRRLRQEEGAQRRADYANMLGRIHRRPGPWTYWGFRPGPRPANSEAWKRTTEIGDVLNETLADPAFLVRRATLARMLREEIPVQPTRLLDWLKVPASPEDVPLILDALVAGQATDEMRAALEVVIRRSSYSTEDRLRALTLFVESLPVEQGPRLLELARSVKEGAVAARLLDALSSRPQLAVGPVFAERVKSTEGVVRAAALRGLVARQDTQAAAFVQSLLHDSDAKARRVAVEAAGELKLANSVETLRELAAGDENPWVRAAALRSLRQNGDGAAVSVAVEALKHSDTHLAAMRYVREFGSPEHLDAVTELCRTHRSTETVQEGVQTLSDWQVQANDPVEQARLGRAIAAVQGETGLVVRWRFVPARTEAEIDTLLKAGVPVGNPGMIHLGSGSSLAARREDGSVGIAMTSLELADASIVEMLVSADGPFEVWINGERAYARVADERFRAYSDRFTTELAKGSNRVVLVLRDTQPNRQWHLSFRRKSSKAEHEQLIRAALAQDGNPTRGRELFLNRDKSKCLSCHRVEGLGEPLEARVGPDLTGIGRRFSRIHVIESILEPSRTIAPSYSTVAFALSDGRVLAGVSIAETKLAITLADREGRMHEVRRDEIEQAVAQPNSTMPEGLEKGLSQREFVDLIAFLMSLR